jgi:hypothetical protein
MTPYPFMALTVRTMSIICVKFLGEIIIGLIWLSSNFDGVFSLGIILEGNIILEVPIKITCAVISGCLLYTGYIHILVHVYIGYQYIWSLEITCALILSCTCTNAYTHAHTHKHTHMRTRIHTHTHAHTLQ